MTGHSVGDPAVGSETRFPFTASTLNPSPCFLVRTAIYAGSFDPITRGHEDLISRSLEFVDRLIVAVATNSAKTAAVHGARSASS